MEEPTLAAKRRNYPGFFGAAFLVLLRIAIGWHLTTEGLYKIMSTPEGQAVLGRYFRKTDGPPFSSEAYNRGATGPLAENFRSLVPDVDGRKALDRKTLEESWNALLDQVAAHYGFDAKQLEAARAALKFRDAEVDAWFSDPEIREKIQKYLDGRNALEELDRKPHKMSYEVERYYQARKGLDADRKSLVSGIDVWTKSLRDAWVNLATEDQAKRAGPFSPPPTEIQLADRVTMYGLTACGIALMVGLFTPIAALGASTFLMLFYLSMPPFPGLPEPPNAEGHYIFVNKNLIEFLACLALAATPNGLWFGFDSLLFGWLDRIFARRAARREDAELRRGILAAETEHEAAPRPRVEVVVDRKNKKSR